MARDPRILANERRYRERHRNRIRKMARARYAANPERARRHSKRWRERNPEKVKLEYQKWLETHPKQRAEINNRYVKNWPHKVRARQRRYYRNNQLRIRDYFKRYLPAYRSRLRCSDPVFLLVERMRSRIRACMAKVCVKKSQRTFDLIGCSPQSLRLHIERLFLPGMTWENRHLWHVDHVKPIAAFDLRDTDQQRAAFHCSNLQPLWAEDNRRKSARILPDQQTGRRLLRGSGPKSPHVSVS